jgi:NIMA (never in mitosis gene a)-related kinase 1/4/5
MSDPASSLHRRSTRDDFEFLERIGRGSSGVVFKVRRKCSLFSSFLDSKVDGQFYVVKQVDTGLLSPEEQEAAINEVHMLASLDSSYVVRYYDSFFDDENLNIVMEWAQKGTLCDRFKVIGFVYLLSSQRQKGRLLPEEIVWKYFLQISLGLFRELPSAADLHSRYSQ